MNKPLYPIINCSLKTVLRCNMTNLMLTKPMKFNLTGKCCTGSSGHVWLTKTDISDISQKLELDPRAFLKKYARWIPRMEKWSLIEKNIADDYHCIFLEGGKLCSVYEVRPVQCRTFPYWPNVMETKETWLEEKLICEGIDNPTACTTPMETINTTLEWQKDDIEQTKRVGKDPFSGK